MLTAGQQAIIKAIPIYMTGEIQTGLDYHLTSDMFEHSANLEPDPDYALIQETSRGYEHLFAGLRLPTSAFFSED